MIDRVYPLVAEGAYGRPSAPPLRLSTTQNTVSIQMPNKAIHKEQEKSLLTNQVHSKDEPILYGRPPARRSAAMEAGRPGVTKRRRGCGCGCCCLISFVATLATVAVIVGVVALVIYLVLKPKAPKFSITAATINNLKLNSNLNVVDTDIVFSVQGTNPNKKISFYYDDVATSLLYENQPIGHGSIPAFYQPHRNTTFLTLAILGHQAPLTSSSASSLQSSLQSGVSIPLQAEAFTKARIKVGGWKSRRHRIHVTCNFQLSNPSSSPGSHVGVLLESCKFTFKLHHITLTFK